MKTLTEQLENQYELHKEAAARSRKAEAELGELVERLRSAEGELAAGDVLRDGFKLDKEKVGKSADVQQSSCFFIIIFCTWSCNFPYWVD